MINNEIIESYLNCKYKAYRKLNNEQGIKTEFELLQDEKLSACKTKFYDCFLEEHGKNKLLECFKFGDNGSISKVNVLIQPTLNTDTYRLSFDAIEIVTNKKSPSRKLHIPIIITSKERFSKKEKLSIAIKCVILSKTCGVEYEFGKIIYGSDLKTVKFKIEPFITEAKRALNELHIISKGTSQPLIFYKSHCNICEFQEACKKELVETDSLGLLHRMGEKDIKRYNNKGIFTITQLSYLFKPRRKRKRKKKANLHFNTELQALAIRTKKIYIQELPDIPRQHAELFLDIEGIPDQNFYYLIGLIICNSNTNSCYHFWANTIQDEERIWKDFLKKVNEYPKAPIYHYGSYESKAIDK